MASLSGHVDASTNVVPRGIPVTTLSGFLAHGANFGIRSIAPSVVRVRAYRIRLNQSSESKPEISAVTAAAAEKRAVISVSFFSSTSRELST